MQRTTNQRNPNVMKNMSLQEKHLQHNSDVGKNTVNWQTKTKANCHVLSIRRQNVRKYHV